MARGETRRATDDEIAQLTTIERVTWQVYASLVGAKGWAPFNARYVATAVDKKVSGGTTYKTVRKAVDKLVSVGLLGPSRKSAGNGHLLYERKVCGRLAEDGAIYWPIKTFPVLAKRRANQWIAGTGTPRSAIRRTPPSGSVAILTAEGRARGNTPSFEQGAIPPEQGAIPPNEQGATHIVTNNSCSTHSREYRLRRVPDEPARPSGGVLFKELDQRLRYADSPSVSIAIGFDTQTEADPAVRIGGEQMTDVPKSPTSKRGTVARNRSKTVSNGGEVGNPTGRKPKRQEEASPASEGSTEVIGDDGVVYTIKVHDQFDVTALINASAKSPPYAIQALADLSKNTLPGTEYVINGDDIYPSIPVTFLSSVGEVTYPPPPSWDPEITIEQAVSICMRWAITLADHRYRLTKSARGAFIASHRQEGWRDLAKTLQLTACSPAVWAWHVCERWDASLRAREQKIVAPFVRVFQGGKDVQRQAGWARSEGARFLVQRDAPPSKERVSYRRRLTELDIRSRIEGATGGEPLRKLIRELFPRGLLAEVAEVAYVGAQQKAALVLASERSWIWE